MEFRHVNSSTRSSEKELLALLREIANRGEASELIMKGMLNMRSSPIYTYICIIPTHKFYVYVYFIYIYISSVLRISMQGLQVMKQLVFILMSSNWTTVIQQSCKNENVFFFVIQNNLFKVLKNALDHLDVVD